MLTIVAINKGFMTRCALLAASSYKIHMNQNNEVKIYKQNKPDDISLTLNDL